MFREMALPLADVTLASYPAASPGSPLALALCLLGKNLDSVKLQRPVNEPTTQRVSGL